MTNSTTLTIVTRVTIDPVTGTPAVAQTILDDVDTPVNLTPALQAFCAGLQDMALTTAEQWTRLDPADLRASAGTPTTGVTRDPSAPQIPHAPTTTTQGDPA